MSEETFVGMIVVITFHFYIKLFVAMGIIACYTAWKLGKALLKI